MRILHVVAIILMNYSIAKAQTQNVHPDVLARQAFTFAAWSLAPEHCGWKPHSQEMINLVIPAIERKTGGLNAMDVVDMYPKSIESALQSYSKNGSSLCNRLTTWVNQLIQIAAVKGN